MNLVPLSSLTELKIVEPKEPEGPDKPKKPKEAARKQALKKQQARQKAARTRAAKAREAQKKAAAENKAKRLARAEMVKKADQEKARVKAEKPPGLDQVPAQIAHCMMALHVKRGKSKEAAWNICRWAMTKYGYLKGPYRKNTKLPKATVQTGKGSTRSFQHGMEKGPLNRGVPGTGTSKFKKFTRMFRDLEPNLVPKRRR